MTSHDASLETEVLGQVQTAEHYKYFEAGRMEKSVAVGPPFFLGLTKPRVFEEGTATSLQISRVFFEKKLFLNMISKRWWCVVLLQFFGYYFVFLNGEWIFTHFVVFSCRCTYLCEHINGLFELECSFSP